MATFDFQIEEQNREITQTSLILQNIEVLAMARNMNSDETQGEVNTVTLAVSPLEARKLIQASERGSIRLLLRSPIDEDSVSISAWRIEDFLKEGELVPIKVMIVDDVKETRDNVRRLLALEDEIVVVGEAKDGEEAVQKVSKIKPDIILMDINMPVLDGLAATEQISVKFPNTSVIMMTVQGELEYIKHAMTVGARIT